MAFLWLQGCCAVCGCCAGTETDGNEGRDAAASYEHAQSDDGEGHAA